MYGFRHRAMFRIVSLALIALLLGSYGCAGYQQPKSPPLAPHMEGGRDRVRLTLVDGRKLELRQALLSNDSIVGLVYSADGPASRGGAPLDEVALLEIYVDHGLGKAEIPWVVVATGLFAVFIVGGDLN